FRVHPPRVKQAVARPASDGSAIVEVTLAPDKRLGTSLVVQGADGSIRLRDDGRDGDAQAADGVYSVPLPLSFALLKRQERVTLARRQALGLLTAPVYDGHALVGQEKQVLRDVPDIVRFLFPVGSTHPNRTVLVTDTGVVEDPARTYNPCSGVASPGTRNGKWTFGYLMQQMANQPATGVDPAELVLDWLNNWTSLQTVNGLDVSPRTAMHDLINRWPRDPVTHKLDLGRAPVKLLAIVNRIDLAANVSYGMAGGAEGRFVFEILDDTCAPQQFLIILEYGVPRTSCIGLRNWALAWRALDALPLGGAGYNAALEALTETFAHAGAGGAKTAGSAINQIRTNETMLLRNADGGAQWELREFALVPAGAGARLAESTVKQTPDLPFNGRDGGFREADLATWINANQAAVLAERHTVPATYPFPPGGGFLGGATPNEEMFIPQLVLDYWVAPGIAMNLARHQFSLNTCNGCHGEESGTRFTHVKIVPFGTAAGLSGFLTGETVHDPVDSSTAYSFNELGRRAVVLDHFADSSCGRIRTVQQSAVQVLPLPPMAYQPLPSTH
ncbi:MAG TPA: choice-of-anchor X domain-containing protein, partial [Polyangia bacterium]|nr:choice-of-anchor X domain-containing protein [Polyangia bacterium]